MYTPASPAPRAVGVALLLLGMFSLPSPAQPTPRTLTGTVTDSHHEPLRGAVVQVRCASLGTVVSFITSESGQYSFKRLSSDLDYSVSATWRGQHSSARKLSIFDMSTGKVIDLTIAIKP